MVNTSQMYRFFLMRKETCWFRLSLTICWYIDYYISICWNNCDSVVLSSRFPPSRLLDFSQWSCQYSVANIVPHSTIYRHCFTSSDELWTLILSFHMKLALNCLCLYLVCLFVCFCRWLHFQCCYRRLDCCVSLIFILISVLFILFYFFFLLLSFQTDETRFLLLYLRVCSVSSLTKRLEGAAETVVESRTS